MGHDAEFAVDAGDAALAGCLIDRLAGDGRDELDGALGGLVDSGAAAENGAVGADLDVYAGELLIGVADDVRAVARAILGGIGVLGVGEGDVLAQKDHVGVRHIQVHVLAGVGGEHTPLVGLEAGVHNVSGAPVTFQVDAPGVAADAQHPGGRHHGLLVGGVHIAVIELAAPDGDVAVLEQALGTVVAEKCGLCHAHGVDLGLFYGELCALEACQNGAVAGEVADVLAVGLGVKVQYGILDGVLAADGDHGREVVGGGVNLYPVHTIGSDGAALDGALHGVGLIHTLLVDHNGGTVRLDAALIEAGGLIGHGGGDDEFRIVGIFLSRHIGNLNAVHQNGDQLALRSCNGFHEYSPLHYRFGQRPKKPV